MTQTNIPSAPSTTLIIGFNDNKKQSRLTRRIQALISLQEYYTTRALRRAACPRRAAEASHYAQRAILCRYIHWVLESKEYGYGMNINLASLFREMQEFHYENEAWKTIQEEAR